MYLPIAVLISLFFTVPIPFFFSRMIRETFGISYCPVKIPLLPGHALKYHGPGRVNNLDKSTFMERDQVHQLSQLTCCTIPIPSTISPSAIDWSKQHAADILNLQYCAAFSGAVGYDQMSNPLNCVSALVVFPRATPSMHARMLGLDMLTAFPVLAAPFRL